MKHDARVHKRFLDYRERYEYFGKSTPTQAATGDPVLPYEAFAKLDAELLELDAKGEDGRDDEEEARFVELTKLLFRD